MLTLYRIQLFILLLSFCLIHTMAPPSQDQAFKYEMDATGRISLNIDELAQFNQIFRVKLQQGSTCQAQYPEPSVLPILKSVFNGFPGAIQEGIEIQGNFYVFELSGEGPNPNLITCTILESKLKETFFIRKTENTYSDYIMTGTKILQTSVYNNQTLMVIRSDKEIIFFQIFENQEPTLPYVMQLSDFTNNVLNSAYYDNNLFSVLTESYLQMYNISNIGDKEVSQIGKFDAFLFPSGETTNMQDLRAMSVCDNVMIIGDSTRLLLIRTDSIDYNDHVLVISKTVQLDHHVLQMKIVGRSLIVLTRGGLYEYIFSLDSMDIRRNSFVDILYLGNKEAIKTGEEGTISLYGDFTSNYYAVLNRVTNQIYLFYSAVIDDGLQDPYLSVLQNLPSTVTSLTIQEKVNKTSGLVDVVLNINYQQNEFGNKIQQVVYRKQPKLLFCSSWNTKTTTEQIQLESQFCSSDIYNYTELSKKNILENDGVIIYDPNQLCTRTINLTLHFYMSMTTMICLIAGAFASLLFLVIVICLIKRRFRGKGKGPHMEFPSEDQEMQDNNWPGSNNPDTPNSSGGDRNARWRTYAQEKKLNLRIPQSAFK